MSRAESEIRRLTLLRVPRELWDDPDKTLNWIIKHHPKAAKIISRLMSVAMTGDDKELGEYEKAFDELEEYMKSLTA